MTRCDILIVGGGPAGSSCAWKLRHAGADVIVLDKEQFPRHKICAGWITPQVIETLQIDTDDYCQNRVLQPLTSFHTGIIGEGEVYTEYDRVVSYGIRRCEFDHYLLQRSAAECRLGESITSIERKNGHWIVNNSIETSMIVGAAGHFCPVSRKLGNFKQPKASVITAQEVEFLVSDEELDRGSVVGETPELFFCNDLLGYGWCFRKGNYLNIGLGRLDSRQVSSHVSAFCDFLRERGKITCEIPSRFHGHAYRLYETVEPRLVAKGAVLIGDAAGLAYPQSGEGIRPAVESGLIAAEVIISADGDYQQANLEPYALKMRQRMGQPRTGSSSDWIPSGCLHFLASRLMATHWFARHVVLDRWFLHQGEAALVTPSMEESPREPFDSQLVAR